MSIGVKLTVGIAVIVVATGYMAYLGASTSWQYYLSTDECVERGQELVGSRMRVSGGVAAGTLHVNQDRSQATFQLQGRQSLLNVVCQGMLPDNLAEGAEVVVEGRLEATGVLHGDKVLTKCASKYNEKNENNSADLLEANERKGV